MQAEAKKSRRVLTALLAQLRKPLAGSALWPTTRAAAALCSGSFEKTYLTKLSGKICGAPTHATELSGLAAELLMFAALTVDDWSDGTAFRAGKPAIYSAHSPERAVLAANCLIEAAHLALNEAAAVVPEKLREGFLKSFRTAAISIQAGQADVLALSGKAVDSVAVMEKLARERCGHLVAAAMSAGAYLTGRTELLPALAKAGLWLGISLQHRNDIQDFTVAYNQMIKPPLADLQNGQPNLVVCFLMQALSRMRPKERTFLLALHGRRISQSKTTLTRREFSDVLALVENYGIARQASSHLAVSVAEAGRVMAYLPVSPRANELADYLELVLQP